MSILIKNMEMPKNCGECVMRYVDHRGYIMCELTHQLVKSGAKDRYDNCPLVEIPTLHSDLVDRNKLLAEYDRQHEGEAGKARKIMEQADAVIEAEGSEE